MKAGAAAQQTSVNVYSDEKAKRMVRTFGASLAFSFLIVWFEMVILRPASDMAFKMKHLDPSEIIGVPFPLTQVTIFSAAPVLVLLAYWRATNSSTVGWKILSFVKVMGFVFIIFGLAGVNVVDTWQHSTMAALFLTTLLCTNLTEKRSSKLLEELPFYDHSDLLCTIRLYMTLGFIIPFSILSVLDHGEQHQRWPVPVLMGGTYGFAFGSIVGICLAYFQAKREEKVKMRS